MRKDALWALGSIAEPLPHDRIDNRYRESKPGDVASASEAFAAIFNNIDSYGNDLKSMIIEVAGKLGYKNGEAQIFDLVKNVKVDKSVRIAALTSLAKLGSDDLTSAINLVMDDKDVELRKEAQNIIDKAGFSDEIKLQIINKLLLTASVEEKQAALYSLSNIKTVGAIELLGTQISKLNDLDPGIKLDVINATERLDNAELNKLIEAYESNKPAGDKLAKYVESLYGGDAEKGKNIFANNESAQCLRCHQVEGYGGEVGPALDGIGSLLDRKDLLLSLVDPNNRIAPGYGNAMYSLNDGTDIVGSVAEEDDEQLTIRDAAGTKHNFKKSDIKSKENLPSGMISQENILSKAELRDLVAFLVTLK